jgi:hypothetical protein
MQTIHPAPGVQARQASRAIGAMFFAVFGAVLLEVWDRRAGAGAALFTGIAAVGIALAASAWLTYRRNAAALALEADSPQKKRADRVFHRVNVGQWVVILVLGNVLANAGLGAWVVPMGIVVVGLHFVPLAHVLRNPSHYLTAAAMVGFALVYPRYAAGGPADPVGFLGAGLILWLNAMWALRRQA